MKRSQSAWRRKNMTSYRLWPYKNFFGTLHFRTEDGALHGIPRSFFFQGRSGTHNFEVSPGTVLWLPVPDPDEFEVPFPLGKHRDADASRVPWAHLPPDLPGLGRFRIEEAGK